MAFSGYYIKVNGTTFPNSLLAQEGYEDTPNQQTDKNSYVDGRGALHRNVLEVTRSSVKFRTIDGLTYGQKLIVKAFFIPRTVITMEYWNDEDDAYKTARFYVPTITYVHKSQDRNKLPIYKALEIEFIAYEGDQ
jgi:hypothetical protein